jgi:hypothetical protein
VPALYHVRFRACALERFDAQARFPDGGGTSGPPLRILNLNRATGFPNKVGEIKGREDRSEAF